MQPPRWDDPVGSACREAEPILRRGLPVRPTLYGFVDGEPVVRVQAGVVFIEGDQLTAQQHLAVVPVVLDLDQLLVFSQVRTRDETIEDEHLRDVLATYGITVEVGYREDGEVITQAHLLELETGSEEVGWQPPMAIPDGLWSQLLHYALDPPAAVTEQKLATSCLAYGLSRAGTVIEVAPGWRERFGMDRLERRDVRAVDRRRLRDVTKRRAASIARGAQEVRP